VDVFFWDTVYDLCKWNFLHNSISIAAAFIDMHGAIDLLSIGRANCKRLLDVIVAPWKLYSE